MKFRRRMPIINAHQCENGLQVTTANGILFANAGDWVVTLENGQKTTCSPEEFPLLFEPISNEEVAEMVKKVALERKKIEAKKVAAKKAETKKIIMKKKAAEKSKFR